MEHSGFKVPSNWQALDWVVWPFFLDPGSSGLLDLLTYQVYWFWDILFVPGLFLKMDQVTLLYLTGIAYLGNSFTCVQYRMCYTCPGPIFWCEFNCDVIGLTKLAILGIGTYIYASSTNFQCKSSCDVNLVIGLTKFGNSRNWYICICIQHWFSMWIQLWCQFSDWTNQIW